MRSLIFAIFFAGALAADIPEEEALALRRIADFWEEREYQIAKNQMESFLEEFPESSYKNTLSSALGDLFLREKNYQTALNYYAQIQDPATIDRIFLHRMQCLYHLEWHATLADECEAYLKKQESNPEHRLQATYLLAIALYSQALGTDKDPQALTALAERAKPFFENLSHSELSEEVSGAFAHLQCILKNYEAASKIYLDLAKKTDSPEEHLFQAALIQSKYDQTLALQTFGQLASQERGILAKEAIYNMLVLHFDQGRYEEIIGGREKFVQSVPSEKEGLAHLFIGQSYLQLKKYSEAASEFNAFLHSDIPEDRVRPALLHLVEAAYHADDLPLLDQAIERLNKTDPEMPKALFSRALLLKKQEKIDEATAQIQSLLLEFSTFFDRPHASFELAQLQLLSKKWASSREAAISFLKEFPNHELSAFAWRVRLSAASELEQKQEFISDLEEMLQKENLFSSTERNDWQFHLAKAYFEKGDQKKTMDILTPLLDAPIFPLQGNANLLFAFYARDTQNDEQNFCLWAEKALSLNASLLPAELQHVALFNSYLKQNKFVEASEHLYAAFLKNAQLQPVNIFWLADQFYKRYEKDPSLAKKAFEVLSKLPKNSLQDAEPYLLKLAKLHRDLGNASDAITILEGLDTQYRSLPQTVWANEKETKVLLAQMYRASNAFEKAEKLFDEVAASGHYRDRFSAEAALESIRMKLPSKDPVAFEKAAVCLKSLVLQKKLEHEPLYLEAALEYIDLLSQKNPEKRHGLLQKIKADFESQDDLLSKDYHAARVKFPEQSKIYLDYMQYLEAEILFEENLLHTKAKEILLQIRSEAKEPLRSRVESLLKNA